MLSADEGRAHCQIINAIADVCDNIISEQTLMSRVWRPLESFAPRCNCRRMLKFGPWRDGSRIVACECGVHFFEAVI